MTRTGPVAVDVDEEETTPGRMVREGRGQQSKEGEVECTVYSAQCTVCTVGSCPTEGVPNSSIE
jgi:hypothetical protein